MKKLIILVAMAFSTAGYSKAVDTDVEKVRTAMKSILGISTSARDLKLDIYKITDSVCGSDIEKVIMIELKVVRIDKAASYDDPFRDFRKAPSKKLETIKTYAVLQSDVRKTSAAQLPNRIMDAEACME